MNHESRRKKTIIHNSLFIIQNWGFTLLEVILYVAIVSIFLTALIPLAWNIIGGGVKNSAQQEVFSQARYVSERIKYEIRNADGINSISSSSISLDVATAANDPTIITLSGTNVTIKLGTADLVNLNSEDTKITSLAFTDYSDNIATGKTKHIQFTFTIDDNFGSTRQEYDVPSYSVESSAEVRSN